MFRLPRFGGVRRLSRAELLGHIWGGLFLLMVLVLTVVLVIKGCLEG